MKISVLVGFSSRQIAWISLLMLAAFVVAGCWPARCLHGSWAKTDGWQCHDQNDERGPQRDQPNRW